MTNEDHIHSILLEKIEKMDAKELSELLCKVLDDSKIEYELGKTNIKFDKLTKEDLL